MLTRYSGKFVEGFYSEKTILEDEIYYENTFSEDKLQKNHIENSKQKDNKLKFRPIINTIRQFIIKNLKKTKNPIIRTNIEISLKFQYFLIKNFNISFKYKEINNFNTYYNIDTERLIYSSTKNKSLYFINDNILEIKLNRKKYIKYFDRNNVNRKILCSPSISIKFLRSVHNEMNSSQKLKQRIPE